MLRPFFLQSVRDWDMMGDENTHGKGLSHERRFIKRRRDAGNSVATVSTTRADHCPEREAAAQGVKVWPCPSFASRATPAATCFLQETAPGGRGRPGRILEETSTLDMLTAVGLPVRHNNKLYNCAAVIQEGKILGLVLRPTSPAMGNFTRGGGSLPAKG